MGRHAAKPFEPVGRALDGQALTVAFPLVLLWSRFVGAVRDACLDIPRQEPKAQRGAAVPLVARQSLRLHPLLCGHWQAVGEPGAPVAMSLVRIQSTSVARVCRHTLIQARVGLADGVMSGLPVIGGFGIFRRAGRGR